VFHGSAGLDAIEESFQLGVTEELREFRSFFEKSAAICGSFPPICGPQSRLSRIFWKMTAPWKPLSESPATLTAETNETL
jgi:hypothetical protein